MYSSAIARRSPCMSGCPTLQGYRGRRGMRGYSRRLGDDIDPSLTTDNFAGEVAPTEENPANYTYTDTSTTVAPTGPYSSGGSSGGGAGSSGSSGSWFNIKIGAQTSPTSGFTIQTGPNGQQTRVPVTSTAANGAPSTAAKPGATNMTPFLIGGGVLLMAVLMGGKR